MNTILYKDKIKDHDIVIVKTDYGAILACAFNKSWFGGSQSCFFPGGFLDLDEAKKVVSDYIDKNILLNNKIKRANEAYKSIMSEVG